MSLNYHFTEAERAAYGARRRAARAAQRAADPAGYAARLATREAEIAAQVAASDARVAAILAGPRVCLSWELVDGKVVRHMRGEKPGCPKCGAEVQV